MKKGIVMTYAAWFLSLALMITAVAAQAAPSQMPALVSADLNERELHLPADLPQERSLLILAFQREQQNNVESWIEGMMLDKSPLPWLEIPVIDNPGMLARWFISSGMRRGIPDLDMRAHVVTLYLDKAAFLNALDIHDESAVYAMVVDRAGHVIETVRGDYSPAGAKKIWQAFAGR